MRKEQASAVLGSASGFQCDRRQSRPMPGRSILVKKLSSSQACWPQPTLPPPGSSGSPTIRAHAPGHEALRSSGRYTSDACRLLPRPGAGPGRSLRARWIHRAGLQRNSPPQAFQPPQAFKTRACGRDCADPNYSCKVNERITWHMA